MGSWPVPIMVGPGQYGYRMNTGSDKLGLLAVRRGVTVDD